MNWLDQVKWDAQGLVPVIAQEQATGDVLMFAWMDREALAKTAELGRHCQPRCDQRCIRQIRRPVHRGGH